MFNNLPTIYPKVTDIETCEGICEQPQHPGCVAVQFHGPHVRGWAGVCLLSNQSAWDPRPQTGTFVIELAHR